MSDATPTPAPSGDSESPADDVLVLSYDGDDYRGEMDAGELAAVLAHLNTLVECVVEDSAPQAHADLKVTAFEHGSFEIHTVVELIRDAAVGVGGPSMIGAAFRFYWKNMRRVVSSYKHIPDRGVFEVTWLSGKVSEMTEAQWRLYNDKQAKKAMRGIAKPLREGASQMELTAGGEHVVVPASDASMFEMPDEHAPSEVNVAQVWVQPETVSFDARKNWRLTNRDLGAFSAKIEDQAFKASVANGSTSIRSNDAFLIRLRTEVSEVDGTVVTKRFVEQVVQHFEGRTVEQDELPVE